MRRLEYGLVVGLTLTIAIAGLYGLSAHMYAEGSVAHVPGDWPAQTRFKLAPKGLTAVMFIHPRCPCSAVAVAQLDQFLIESHSDLRVQIVYLPPGEGQQAWINSSIAQRISGSRSFDLIADKDSRESTIFGVTTSGHFCLFDDRGHKLIDGGLTNGRGVEGPSAGLNALAMILEGKTPAVNHFPVYGCGLIEK